MHKNHNEFNKSNGSNNDDFIVGLKKGERILDEGTTS
jgi:hypothetical protein